MFERAGGEQAFLELIDRFYDRVEQDEVLRPIYPEDLEPGKTHLARFFMQYWGAGPVYSAQRGHPRLRMRHAPFEVTPEAARRWAEHMLAAIDEMDFPEDVTAALSGYVIRFAPSMINTPGAPGGETLPQADPDG
ncbi:MAG: globin [Nitriliruptorales bacterium]|nr:globin [Nitriliruptorales bacterium]